jgi:hypothetical protein
MYRPETVRLPLSDDGWILIKKRLTAGETRHIFGRMVKKMVPGQPVEVDPEQAGLANVVEYLVDWNVTDFDGRPIPIRDQPPEFIASALNELDASAYAEIQEAISTHIAAMDAALAEEKKIRTGAPESSATSTSVA